MDATLNDRIHSFRMLLAEPTVSRAIAPSGSALATDIVSRAGVARSQTIVQLGGRKGAIREAIRHQAQRDAMIITVEISRNFAQTRSHVVTNSAERISDYLRAAARTSADCVVSAVPWTGFSDAVQSQLLAVIHKALVAGGTFTAFAYLHASWLPAARRFRDRLDSAFSTVHVTPVIWANFPPAVVYACVK
jgi:phosphatidylethanolamine/phosphatidyl-N-methylethanolamine N-methyltransferase